MLSLSWMHSAMDLATRSILEIRSVLEMTGRRVALGRMIGGSLMSSSKTRRTIELCAVRLDLTLVEAPLSVIEGLVGGFRGTVVFGKLLKVKANPAAASIWMLTLAEKKMPDLNAIEIAVRTPEKSPLPGAPTVRMFIRQVHQGYARR